MVDVSDLVGTPFVNGGRDVNIGLDCWGLVMEVFRRHGVDVPDFTVDALAFDKIDAMAGEASVSRKWEEVFNPSDDAVPLVVLMRVHPIYVTHAGVLLGGNRVIHTIQNANTVITRVGLLKHRTAGFYRPC